ncbi:hypothetical protein [Paenibacillus sp. YPG26]|uniref:hypothetical protein n=1 Tax=Paenibacillus sp. YPG26 TaxID=2878915 RepID=UPI00203AD9CA|nr:hypothetical protein [Paenibacillus sp. YPG26]USB34481.1 hypothetical protein LDO05_06830 [Paenibacillus sp. YPG26]
MSEAVAQLYESLHVVLKAPGQVLSSGLIDQLTDLGEQDKAENCALAYAHQASYAVGMAEMNKSAADLPYGQVCSYVEKPSENSHRAFLFSWDNLWRRG